MPIRVVRGVVNHWPTRYGEWILAAMLAGIGWRILMPDRVFDLPSLVFLAGIFDEQEWGASCFVVGLVRLTALVINGTLYDIEPLRKSRRIVPRVLVLYSRYSPHVRAAMALLTCLFWFTISFSLIASGATGWGFITYGGLFLLDLWNASRASVDADKVNRNVPA